MKTITDEQFYMLVDYKMSEPVPLRKADLNEPFIYDREYGVFYIEPGHHILGMSMLYAWKKGYLSVYKMKKNEPEIKEKLSSFYSGIDRYQYLADEFLLHCKGTAMSSSVANFILIGELSNLNEEEKIVFGNYKIQTLNINK